MYNISKFFYVVIMRGEGEAGLAGLAVAAAAVAAAAVAAVAAAFERAHSSFLG